MLIEIKHSDKSKIEDFIRINSLFLREYYTPLMPEGDISSLEQFNSLKTISQEIKDGSYNYYSIYFQNENIGNVVLKEMQDFIDICEIFILKKYRKQCFSYKALKIAIGEVNKKLSKIAEKWGFTKSDFAARYIGDDIYLYENLYNLRVHVK